MIEFENVAAMQAHYKAVRRRLMGPPPKTIRIVPPPAAIEAPPPEPKPPELTAAEYLKHVGRLRTDLTLMNALALVAKRFGMTYGEIRARSRCQKFVVPRQITIWFCKKYKVQPLVTMAHYLNMDHTTMLHAYQKMERHLKTDGKLKPLILATEEYLLAAFNRTPLPSDH